MKEYYPRIGDALLKHHLASKGAVLIEGLKWCGKTTTALQAADSVIYLQDPRTRAQNLRLAELDPGLLLEGATPRLIDEWQEAPELWDAVRFEVDMRDQFGQFILTGSTVPPDLAEIRHSGTGRISRMRMRTMSLLESRDSTGAVSLSKLFKGESLPMSPSEDGLAHVAYLACRGGWPKALDQPESVALQQAVDYVDAVAESDISRFDGVRRDANKTRYLLRSYARMVSSQGSFDAMRADMESIGSGLSESVFRQYLDALRGLYVIEDLAAWHPNLRSKTSIRTSATRHFADPSIACAALGAGPDDLIADLETFGLVFEDLCIRDLRIYADALGGQVYHYRDKSGLECDAVVHLKNGSYGLIEVKLGGQKAIDEGAANLRILKEKLDASRMGKPAFLMVLTATGGYSYPREDGVYVVPVRVLGV